MVGEGHYTLPLPRGVNLTPPRGNRYTLLMPFDILSLFIGSKQERDLKTLAPLVRRISALEPELTALATAEFPAAPRTSAGASPTG